MKKYIKSLSIEECIKSLNEVKNKKVVHFPPVITYKTCTKFDLVSTEIQSNDYLIGIDKLILKYILPENLYDSILLLPFNNKHKFGDITLIPKPYSEDKKSGNYNPKINVYHKNIYIGNMYLKLSNRRFTPDNLKFEFSNKFMYTRNNTFTNVLLSLQKELSLAFQNVQNLDIYLDTNQPIINDLLWFLNRSYFNENKDEAILQTNSNFDFYRYNAKGRKNKYTYSVLTNNSNILIQPTKDRVISIYNKTDEIKHSKKDYIQSLHRQFLSDSDNITRIELRLKNDDIKLIINDLNTSNGIEALLSIITNSSKLYSIFYSHVQKEFIYASDKLKAKSVNGNSNYYKIHAIKFPEPNSSIPTLKTVTTKSVHQPRKTKSNKMQLKAFKSLVDVNPSPTLDDLIRLNIPSRKALLKAISRIDGFPIQSINKCKSLFPTDNSFHLDNTSFNDELMQTLKENNIDLNHNDKGDELPF